MSRVFVTGIGVISALGDCTRENHRSLVEGKTGIGRLELFDTRYAQLPFAEIKKENPELKDRLGVTEKGVSRTSLLALHAFEEAIKDSELSQSALHSFDTALVAANTVAGMCLTDELYRDANRTEKGSEYLGSYDCGSVTLFLQQRSGIKGVTNTINTACSSSANAIMYGARLIKNGFAKRAVVGGVDSLAKFTINGFNSLFILSSDPCKPFDKNRSGLNLGEGAAFLVLEREEDLAGKKIYAELSGYCNANDAFHASSLSDNGRGPFLAMKGALETAGLQAHQINYVNAHGTGTENNDQVESTAMLRLFEQVPAFSSTKSNIGHTLGASGAIEAVYGILSLQGQELYPQLNFDQAIPETGLQPVNSYRKQELRHIMSNSFGFGGNCSSLIFSAV